MKASTVAEFFVDSEGVRVEVEVGAADLDAFRNLLPDSVYDKLGHHPRPLQERLPEFFDRDCVIRSGEGEPLSGRVVEVAARQRLERDEITGEPLTMQPEDAERVLFIQLMYSWKKRPDSISIQPPLGQDGRTPAANVGFVLYHDGVPVNDFRYLANGSTVDLDWSDPWYSRFRNRNLRRQYDAPLSVFLYVDHFEIRKEIVARPKDLQQWVDLGLKGKQTIAVERQAELKQRVAEFLSERATVSVNGQPVQGTLDRIHFVRRTLRTTSVVDPPEPLDINLATLGVIFVYPIERLPQQATVTWDLFSPRIQVVPAAATDEAGGLPSRLTADDPVLQWKNFLTNPSRPAMMTVARPESRQLNLPVVSGICFVAVALLIPLVLNNLTTGRRLSGWPIGIGAAALILGMIALPYGRLPVMMPFSPNHHVSPQQAKEVLHALLYNVYRSFDRRDESFAYDQLARSISGDLLTDVYLQVRRSTELANQGGARVKIDQVDVIDVVEQSEPENGGQSDSEPNNWGPNNWGHGLAYRCRWNASGSVGHWGHIHRRTNQYDAVIKIEPIEGDWKITGIDLREELRLDPNRTPS